MTAAAAVRRLRFRFHSFLLAIAPCNRTEVLKARSWREVAWRLHSEWENGRTRGLWRGIVLGQRSAREVTDSTLSALERREGWLGMAGWARRIGTEERGGQGWSCSSSARVWLTGCGKHQDPAPPAPPPKPTVKVAPPTPIQTQKVRAGRPRVGPAVGPDRGAGAAPRDALDAGSARCPPLLSALLPDEHARQAVVLGLLLPGARRGGGGARSHHAGAPHRAGGRGEGRRHWTAWYAARACCS